MGLREAVTEIADQMEKEIDDEYDVRCLGWVRQLRSALKASEGQNKGLYETIVLSQPIEERAKKQQQKQIGQEETDPTFKLCCGGVSDGVMIPTTPDTPATARTWVSGEVYEFDGKQWNFNQSVTEKMRQEIQRKK